MKRINFMYEKRFPDDKHADKDTGGGEDPSQWEEDNFWRMAWEMREKQLEAETLPSRANDDKKPDKTQEVRES